MAENDRKKVQVEKEMRSKGISKMIGEGGLGAEKYYEIKKSPSPSNNEDGSVAQEEESEKGK